MGQMGAGLRREVQGAAFGCVQLGHESDELVNESASPARDFHGLCKNVVFTQHE